MTEPQGSAGPGPEPRRSRLGRILDEHPEARPRVRSAVSSLLATTLATIAIVGVLLIWHLRRRARMIRERLAPPRRVSLPDLTAKDEEDHGTVARD